MIVVQGELETRDDHIPHAHVVDDLPSKHDSINYLLVLHLCTHRFSTPHGTTMPTPPTQHPTS